MRRIVVVTGTRADYGLLKPILDLIIAEKDLDLCLIVTGMHLLPDFGHSVDLIEADGVPIAARVDMLLGNDSAPAMAKGVGIGTVGMTQAMEGLQPDIVLVLGDRVEAFAGAIAGLFCGAVLGHIHGGEVTQGGYDEYMRHAITKLSHVHFAATSKSRDRIIKMGEHPEFVYHTGAPGLDALLGFPILSLDEINQKININISKPYALVVQHPVSSHPETAVDEIKATLQALEVYRARQALDCVLVYPNADAGNRGMVKLIQEYEAKEWLYTFKNLPRMVYTNLLRHASVLVGNSSSGMLDSATFGVPVVNIGERQQGRERGENVLDVIPDQDEILHAIYRCLNDSEFIQQCRESQNPYGDGHASNRIVDVLKLIDLEDPKRSKQLPW